MDSTKQEAMITGNKQYRIKSWQIALAGTVIQILLLRETLYYLLYNQNIPPLGALLLIPFIIYSIVGLISIPLLYFTKTRKIGAIVSIIISLASTSFFISNSGIEGLSILGIQEVFVMFAGIYYFWKKV